MNRPDVPESVRNVGSLLDVYLRLDIPLNGGEGPTHQATIRPCNGVPYVFPPAGPYGTLWLGSHRQKETNTKSVRQIMPAECVKARTVLTKYPYSLLIALVRLVMDEPRDTRELNAWVPEEKAVEWCSQYGLPEEGDLADVDGPCLCLSTFQWEVTRLYLIFRLWKVHIEWQEFSEENAGPIDFEVVERQREDIRRYAMLLMKVHGAQSRLLTSAAPTLRAYCNRERSIKRRLEQVGLSGRQLKADLRETMADVDEWVKEYIHEIISQRNWSIAVGFSPMRQKAPGMFLQTASLFDVAYLQLGSLTLKPPGDWRLHWKSCAWPAGCGRQFWARHGHAKYCEEHDRRRGWLGRHPRAPRHEG